MKKKLFLGINVCLVVSQITYGQITISPLSPDRWQEYRMLRLQALAEDPVAFTIAVDDEAKKPDEYWYNRLKLALKNDALWLLFAECEGKLVGMIGAIQEYQEYTYSRHLATIISFYVVPGKRGLGIGNLLLNAMIESLKEKEEIQVILLWVAQEKEAAIKLYEKSGFIKTGVLEKSILINNRFFDLVLMQKVL